jgi:tetratricopeptide (TPR) repeat protein
MASHYEAALYSVLTYLGCPLRYDDLLVLSGSAFRTAWLPGHYGYYSRTVSPDDALLVAGEALGATVTRQVFKTDEDAWPVICQSIDDHRPVILCHASAANIICGYDADRNEMVLQAYDTSEPGYLTRPYKLHEGPTFRPREVVFVDYPGGAAPEPDWPTILARAVRYADWPADQTLLRGHVFGLTAYDAWAQTLRGGLDPEDPEISARFTYTYALVIQDAREAASVVLQDHGALHGAFAEAAAHYMREAEILATMRTVLAGGMTAGWQAVSDEINRRFPEPAIREAAAQVVEQAKAEEVQAVDCLREAVAALGPPEAPPTAPPAEDKTALAREHCAKGRDLKGAGQFEAAAKELRRALEADPNLADAHWILGWVLVELKDDPGATEAFKAVIRLEAGTDRAQEAQKALDRLGP